MINNKKKKIIDLSNMNQKEIFLIIRKILGSKKIKTNNIVIKSSRNLLKILKVCLFFSKLRLGYSLWRKESPCPASSAIIKS